MKTLKRILQELVLIRKELQAIRSSKEFTDADIDVACKYINGHLGKAISRQGGKIIDS